MKKHLMIRTLALIIALAGGAHADDTSTTPGETIKRTDVSDTDKPAGEGADLDTEITNAKLRAESGSKNRFSMKANLNLNGGAANAPLTQDRPNISAAGGVDTNTSLAGTVAGAYRLSTRAALRFGTGIAVRTPFQDSIQSVANAKPDNSLNEGRGGRTTDISNPYVDYGYNFRFANVQNAFDTNYTAYTQTLYKTVFSENGTYDINHTFMWEFSGTKWSPGVNFDANYTFFSRPATGQETGANSRRTDAAAPLALIDLELAIYPVVEYAFTDRLSFRTVFRPWIFDHYRNDEGGTFVREIYTQSVGVGYAITRDIYTYPNFQFAPQNLSPQRTNVGISATINL